MSKNLKNKIAEGGVVALLVIGILAFAYGLSWIVTCGIIKLITMCFGWTFKWSIATGIWLIICILRGIFSVTVKLILIMIKTIKFHDLHRKSKFYRRIT